MAYATIQDIQARMTRALNEREQAVCTSLLDDAAVMIDAYAAEAPAEVKALVSVRMVIRSMGSDGLDGIPIGATQGSMTGLGYTQSWTVSGGTTGELYLSKTDKQILGRGNSIGSYSPAEALVTEVIE